KAEGQFLRGSFVADADVVNWQASAKAARNQQQRGIMVIKARNLALADLLSGLGRGFRPENQLRFSGNVSGATDVQWRQSIDSAEARVVADIVPPATTPAGRIPLTAKVHGDYDFRSGNVQLSE